MHTNHSKLKTGVGLRSPHLDQFLNSSPNSVSWVEVVAENYMEHEDHFQGVSIANLEQVRSHLPVILHGVSLSIASTDPIKASHMKRLKNLIDRIQPEWVSDHLCWTGVDGENLHDLLPLPFTREAIFHVVDRIKQVQDYLGQRILIENISSYLEFTESEMTEWEFLKEVAERSDCHILLDVNNVYVNSINHGFDAQDYLEALSQDRIQQIHIAGHVERNGVLIDTHSTNVRKEVWDLYRESVRLFGPIPAMIERDADIPEWEELEKEVEMISRITTEESHEAEKVAARI